MMVLLSYFQWVDATVYVTCKSSLACEITASANVVFRTDGWRELRENQLTHVDMWNSDNHLAWVCVCNCSNSWRKPMLMRKETSPVWKNAWRWVRMRTRKYLWTARIYCLNSTSWKVRPFWCLCWNLCSEVVLIGTACIVCRAGST